MARAATDLAPKVAAAGKVTVVLGALFTLAAAAGIVVPEELQEAVVVAAVDIAALVPLVAAYLKEE